MTNDQFTQLNQRLDSIEQRLEEGFSRPASLVLDEVLALEQRTNERLDRLTGRVEQLVEGQQSIQATVGQLAENQQAMQATVGQLAEGQQAMQATVGQLIQAMFESSRQADADREQMRELQSEVRGLQAENRRILDYLFGQRRNGNGEQE